MDITIEGWFDSPPSVDTVQQYLSAMMDRPEAHATEEWEALMVNTWRSKRLSDLDRRLQKGWGNLSPGERSLILAAYVDFLLRTEDITVIDDAVSLLGPLASEQEVTPLLTRCLEGDPTRRAAVVRVLDEVFKRSGGESILSAYRDLLTQSMTEAAPKECEVWQTIYGIPLQALAESGDPLAVEVWVRWLERGVESAFVGDQTRFLGTLAGFTGVSLDDAVSGVQGTPTRLSPELADRVEAVLESRQKAFELEADTYSVPCIADSGVVMLLEAAGRPQWASRAREACWTAFRDADEMARLAVNTAGEGEANQLASLFRKGTADELLRLRDSRIVPELILCLRSAGPIDPVTADSLLRSATGESVSGYTSADMPINPAAAAEAWSRWWAEHGDEFLKSSPFRR